jgi:hypothetical protein
VKPFTVMKTDLSDSANARRVTVADRLGLGVGHCGDQFHRQFRQRARKEAFVGHLGG